jgi:hypothetical protein
MLTRYYDTDMAVKLLSDEEREDIGNVNGEPAHIIPFSLKVCPPIQFLLHLLTLNSTMLGLLLGKRYTKQQLYFLT